MKFTPTIRCGFFYILDFDIKGFGLCTGSIQSKRKLKERWAFTGEQLLLVAIPNKEDGKG